MPWVVPSVACCSDNCRWHLRSGSGLAAALARQQYMVAGAMKRITQRHLSMAFEKWQYEAAELKHQQQLLQRGLMQMIKRQLAMASTTGSTGEAS